MKVCENRSEDCSEPTNAGTRQAARRIESDFHSTRASVHASESGAAAAAPNTSSLVALLTHHVLRDGEVVLLALKPSLWLLVFQSIGFAAVVVLGYLATRVFHDSLPLRREIIYWESAIFLIVGRLMVAVMQWMARWYVLTDQRVIRLSGIFSPEIFSCPLRKIARTQLTYSVKERMTRLGSIEIYPGGDGTEVPDSFAWQAIARPVEIHEQMVAAIRRAHNG